MNILKKFKWYHIPIFFFVAMSIYLMTDYQHSKETEVYMETTEAVKVIDQENITFEPSISNGVGIIFYPGGKVAPQSYAPLMYQLSELGYTCYIVKMPFNLAFLNINGAEDIIKKNSEIQEWYMAGHSLGGVMGTQYVINHPNTIKGIIYLASYPADNMSLSNDEMLRTLSIYAEKDGFITLDEQKEHLKRLPSEHQVVTIKGANHSQFGFYGFQSGDNSADISTETQQRLVLSTINEWLSEVK